MTNIVINDIDPTNQYVATAAQTNFVYDYPIREETDIDVYQTPNGDEPDDLGQKLILNVDYTLTGVGSESGGEVVLAVGATAGDRITIYRNMPLERLQNYVQNQEFNVESFNRDFNNIIMMMQQLRAVQNKIETLYQKTGLVDSKNLKLPLLETNEIWKKTALGIEGVILEEDPGANTLRSELANDASGTDGSRIVGHYSSVAGSTTVHAELERVLEAQYNNDTGSANVYQVALSPAPGAYYSGYTIYVKIANTNTAASTSTLQVNGLGTKSIVAMIEGVLGTIPANTLIVGMIAQFVFDAATQDWKLINPNITNASGIIGEVRWGHFTASEVPSGWFFYEEGTIGNAASGATVRANADVEALYTFYWNNYSSPSGNAKMTVSGGLGASALADFSANKQMDLPHLGGRSLGVAGTVTPTPTTPFTSTSAEVIGNSTHTLTVAQMPAHTHTYDFPTYRIDEGNKFGPDWNRATESFTTGSRGGGEAHSIMQPSTYMNVMIKL